TFYQYLKKIRIENGKLISLTVVDPGCCAEYVEQELMYKFDEDFHPQKVLQRGQIGSLAEKYGILESPIKFRVENDGYKLRGDPVINDTNAFVYDFEGHGNTLAIF